MEKKWFGPASLILVLSAVLQTLVFADEPSLAPLNPAFVNPPQTNIYKTASSNFTSGYKPMPLSLAHLQGQIAQFSVTKRMASVLPSSYDLRTTGKLTPIGTQGNYGSCWAFASFGSLESALLPDQSWDFSVNNLVNQCGFNGPWNGGNSLMATAYLVGWSGPVCAADDPYPYQNVGGDTGARVQKHVQEALWLPDRENSSDNDNIKNAVMTYGAVYTSFFYSDQYFNQKTNSYFCKTGGIANHAVDIVGWIDSYQASQFSPAAPGNGAFIVRNSWGTDWGESGYFYVSYYDANLASNPYWGGAGTTVFDSAESITNYSQIYQYDPLGECGALGFGGNTGYFANIFTASNNQQLSAVGFYTNAFNSTYKISVYTGVGSSPVSGKQVVAGQSGTITVSGYHTIALDTPVALAAGQKFSIVAQVMTPGYDYPIALELPVRNYSDGATAGAGQSWVSSNGKTWADVTIIYANANVCLKGYAAPTSGIISGRVAALDGATAIAGAIVQAVQTGVTISSAASNSSGNYIITVPTGSYSVCVSSTGYIAQTQYGILAAANPSQMVNFCLSQTPGIISGAVTIKNGGALTGATVRASQSGVIISSAVADSSGRYSIFVPSGIYDVCASSAGYFPATQTARNVVYGKPVTGNFSLTAYCVSVATISSVSTVVSLQLSGGNYNVYVPEGSFAAATVLTVSNAFVEGAPLQSTVNAAQFGISIKSEPPLQPLNNITITLHYSTDDIEGMNAQNLAIAAQDPASSKWVALESNVDTAQKTVTANANHLGLFAIVGLGSPGKPDDVNDAYCFPSPVRFSVGEKLHFSNFSPNAVAYIISTAGNVLKKFVADSTGAIPAWDGVTDSGENMALGVYIVRAKDEKGKKKVFEIMVLR